MLSSFKANYNGYLKILILSLRLQRRFYCSLCYENQYLCFLLIPRPVRISSLKLVSFSLHPLQRKRFNNHFKKKASATQARRKYRSLMSSWIVDVFKTLVEWSDWLSHSIFIPKFLKTTKSNRSVLTMVVLRRVTERLVRLHMKRGVHWLANHIAERESC